MITLQQILDAGHQAFVVEGKPPAKNDAGCFYLLGDGRRCAVGLVLPDGHKALAYRWSLSGLVEGWPELFSPEVRRMSCNALNIFQAKIHDELATDSGTWLLSREELHERYIQVAEEYGLTPPAPLE